MSHCPDSSKWKTYLYHVACHNSFFFSLWPGSLIPSFLPSKKKRPVKLIFSGLRVHFFFFSFFSFFFFNGLRVYFFTNKFLGTSLRRHISSFSIRLGPQAVGCGLSWAGLSLCLACKMNRRGLGKTIFRCIQVLSAKFVTWLINGSFCTWPRD